jgi:protocatechuate 3,4-dioxygenase, beta subunit
MFVKNIAMKFYLLISCFSIIALSACSQPKKAGGPCEGCEAIYENPVPFSELPFIDTLPGYYSPGQKILIKGTVLKSDGKNPAAGVILYLYHTNAAGIYPTTGTEKGWGRRHGFLRGWLKTNAKGEYAFFTIRPGAYPASNNPEHIHITIKEPGRNEYWLDDFNFDDDPLLTNATRKKFSNRGGSGIIKISRVNGIMTGYRNIILGKNIPGYE